MATEFPNRTGPMAGTLVFSSPPPLHPGSGRAGNSASERTTAEVTQMTRQLKHSESLQRAIFEQAPDALMLVAPGGPMSRRLPCSATAASNWRNA
jgi:hypothetical protein